jgi:hypothetical protein
MRSGREASGIDATPQDSGKSFQVLSTNDGLGTLAFG